MCSSLLAEHAITGEGANLMIELYEQHRDNIISHLEATGVNFILHNSMTNWVNLVTGIAAPNIVDIDWRLDYSVRSKHGGRNNIPMYFLSLKVRDRGLLRNVDMIASLEELQDLLASVSNLCEAFVCVCFCVVIVCVWIRSEMQWKKWEEYWTLQSSFCVCSIIRIAKLLNVTSHSECLKNSKISLRLAVLDKSLTGPCIT